MRIALLSGGAAGMVCGSCLHDNALATALIAQGHDAVLVPLYTPLRTDEPSVAGKRVFYGAVNTYLQVRSERWSRLPAFLRRWLDRPALLDWVGKLGSAARGEDLGALALAVLEGEHGPSHQLLDQLVAWLKSDLRPEVVHLQSSMFVGFARRLHAELGVPIVCSLQGEDLFLDSLIEPWRGRALAELRRRQAEVDVFVTNSEYYRSHMAATLGIDPARILRVPLGLSLAELLAAPRPARPAGAPFVVGYFARICPEKGFGVAAAAFKQLAALAGPQAVQLRVAGYLGAKDRAFFAAELAALERAGLGSRVEVVGEVDRAGKIAFLAGLDALAVPTVYREPKGLFALEAMAVGVPVVLPSHGAFPEMIAETGGGVLVPPEDPAATAAALLELAGQPERRRELGERGRAAVAAHHAIATTASETLAVYRRALAARQQQEKVPA